MTSKFLQKLDEYAKANGLNGLAEAVPGSTPITAPAANSTPQPIDPSLEKLNVDELSRKEADHIKSTQDITSRIQKGAATPEDYTALDAAMAGLKGIQQIKSKLTGKSTTPGGPVTTATASNSLSKPLI